MGRTLAVGRIVFVAALLVMGFPPKVHAQAQEEQTAESALEEAHRLYGPPPPMENCSDDQEAAILSGEIVVCRRKRDDSEFRTLPSGDAQARYAQETMNRGNPQTPDVSGEGIFKGPATVSGLCIIGPCPKPPALIIDVTALPQAPPGSDADRIAHGLPPLGLDDDDRAVLSEPANRAESAEPADEP
ncbi:MAG: hypothetical protein C0510_11265 [Erythrobacter sp.]|nr:hypothetical protein [Erythrobacter sp.]